jgi:outer membrane immunogenic protein
MKKFLCSVIGCFLIAVAAPAGAADLALPAPAPVAAPSWTGFYVGAGLGFRSSNTNATVTSATTTVGALGPFNLIANNGCNAGVPCALGEPFNGTSFRFAPYLGYDWQIAPRWVVGLEGDFGIGNQTTSLNGGFYPAPTVLAGISADSFAVKTTWDASARVRAGYLVDPTVLFYVTGGPAWLRIEPTSNCSTAAAGNCPPGALAPAVITDGTTRLGGTVGAGIEAMLWANWMVRFEYRYANFGTISNTDLRTCPASGCGAAFTETVGYNVKVQTHTATFGLAYEFSDPVLASAAAPLVYKYRNLYNYAGPWADPPAAAAASWTGPYLGAGIGVRATTTTANLDSATAPLPGGPFDLVAAACINKFGTGCFLGEALNGTAFLFNPYAGFNWQFATRWVAGIEGDFDVANQKTTLAGNFAPGSPGIVGSGTNANNTFAVATTWDASLRARIGYLVNPSFLIYGAAGPAWMHIEQTSNCDSSVTFVPFIVAGSCTPGLLTPAGITDSITKLGFTVAAGGEAKLWWSNWFLRGEYRFTDFGTVRFTDVRSCASPSITINGNTTFGCTPITFTDDLRVRTHTATAGIAYKFYP